jgi:hypothetical protein
LEQDGEWHRYYGFVGVYRIAKVPAAEIEFERERFAMPLRHGFTYMVVPPSQTRMENRDGSSYFQAVPLNAGDSQPFSLKLGNISGLDQRVPGSFMLPPSPSSAISLPRTGGVVTLPAGIKLYLDYTPQSASLDTVWESVPQKSTVATAAPQPAGNVLLPTEMSELLKGDLRDYFDTNRPGLYSLHVEFTFPDGSAGKDRAWTFLVKE